MTKKDYELIADILAVWYDESSAKKKVVQRFSNRLSLENPRFLKQKFISACYSNNTITFTLPDPEYIEDWIVG